MKKKRIYIFVSIIFSMFLFYACSKENAEPAKGVIEEFTQRTGKEAAEKIKSPLAKARSLQEKSAENVSRSESLLDE